jgi:1-deoxy-D-xylulose 5-phosphate reductoisomerase
LPFTGITALIDRVMQAHTVGAADTLDAVMAADAWARERAVMSLV